MLLESVAPTVDISSQEIDRLGCIESVPHRKPSGKLTWTA
jgi:hypothetical protein